MAKKNVDFGFWDKIKYIFSDPNLFFDRVKSEKGIKNSLLMYAIVALFFSVINFALQFGLTGRGPMIFGHLISFSYLIATSPFANLTLGLIIAFAFSGLIHALIKAFKGKGTYSNSFNIYAYSMIPYLVLSVIPLIGFFAIIYSFILMIIGLSKVHDVSKGKAAVACLLPAIVVFGLMVIARLLLISMFVSNF